MVQSIEHFGTELKIETFGQFEPFAYSYIQIPITRSFKNVAPGAIAAGGRYCKRRSILENDWTEHSRNILQSNWRRGADDIRTRLMRKIRCANTTAHTEGLSGHE